MEELLLRWTELTHRTKATLRALHDAPTLLAPTEGAPCVEQEFCRKLRTYLRVTCDRGAGGRQSEGPQAPPEVASVREERHYGHLRHHDRHADGGDIDISSRYVHVVF